MTSAELVPVAALQQWVGEHGPSLGLVVEARAGALWECWPEHPVAVHELTGLYLAWTALLGALDPEPVDVGAIGLPGPRDWLDLANASAPAVARALTTLTTCARSGRHITPPTEATVAGS